jgi:hypothetical protein
MTVGVNQTVLADDEAAAGHLAVTWPVPFDSDYTSARFA